MLHPLPSRAAPLFMVEIFSHKDQPHSSCSQPTPSFLADLSFLTSHSQEKCYMRESTEMSSLSLAPSIQLFGILQSRKLQRWVITMKDRRNSRRPLQKGRYLSIEGIQTVQALKRASLNGGSEAVTREIKTKVRRLLKFDLVAVLRELERQEEGILAFQIFEELRKENWYRPGVPVYVELISVLAKNGLHEEVELACSYLKAEHLEPDTDGFNQLLKTLLDYRFTQMAMDCFRLMKLWESEPNEYTFRILISGLESSGGNHACIDDVRDEAKNLFGKTLDFVEFVE